MLRRLARYFLPSAPLCKMPSLIGTHNGTFHADEALAIAILRTLPAFKHHSILRTRDSAKLAECDIVVDVGGVYDHQAKRYDHHQPEFKDTFSPKHTILLSSAGLVYKHYGKDLVRELAKDVAVISETEVDDLYLKVYKSFVEPFDAIENGVSQYPDSVEPAYSSPYSLQNQVSALNPLPCEKDQDPDICFLNAVDLLQVTMHRLIQRYLLTWLPSRRVVSETLIALSSTTTYESADSRIVVFKEGCNWKDHLAELEPKPGHFLFVVYPEDANGTWRVQGVPLKPGSFELRLGLPEEWRGLRDEELCKKSGIKESIFVHRNGFIGGNVTLEGAKEMARKAINISTSK